MKTFRFLAILISSFFTIAAASPSFLITKEAAGDISLGATIAQVRHAIKPQTLSTIKSGEGLTLFALMQGKQTLLTLFTGQPAANNKPRDTDKVKVIEIFDARYHTAAGVHPGMTIQEIENQYGKLNQIMRSEMESREVANFTQQPAGMTFRVSGKQGRLAGKYTAGSNITSAFQPGTYLVSITLREPIQP